MQWNITYILKGVLIHIYRYRKNLINFSMKRINDYIIIEIQRYLNVHSLKDYIASVNLRMRGLELILILN